MCCMLRPLSYAGMQVFRQLNGYHTVSDELGPKGLLPQWGES